MPVSTAPRADSALIDSPGLTEFGLHHLSPEGIAHAFIELRPLLGHCRFRNCRHDHEPDCSVLLRQSVKVTSTRAATRRSAHSAPKSANTTGVFRMSDIIIRRQHGQDVAPRRARRLNTWLSELNEEFDLSYDWDGDVMRFKRPGVAGESVGGRSARLSLEYSSWLPAVRAQAHHRTRDPQVFRRKLPELKKAARKVGRTGVRSLSTFRSGQCTAASPRQRASP
jgi:hypothetical protein